MLPPDRQPQTGSSASPSFRSRSETQGSPRKAMSALRSPAPSGTRPVPTHTSLRDTHTSARSLMRGRWQRLDVQVAEWTRTRSNESACSVVGKGHTGAGRRVGSIRTWDDCPHEPSTARGPNRAHTLEKPHRRGRLLSQLPSVTETGAPYGIRTRVPNVKGWCPRPLDEGSEPLGGGGRYRGVPRRHQAPSADFSSA